MAWRKLSFIQKEVGTTVVNSRPSERVLMISSGTVMSFLAFSEAAACLTGKQVTQRGTPQYALAANVATSLQGLLCPWGYIGTRV